MKNNMSRTLVLLSCLLIAFTATAGYTADTSVIEKRQTIQVVDQGYDYDVVHFVAFDMEVPSVFTTISPDLGVAKTATVPMFERTLKGYVSNIRPLPDSNERQKSVI